jgi:hypothetical protein
VLRSTLPRSTFFSDFGSETLRSALSGRRESLRLFKATPPAIPASAAPPAINGVFAFEASSATFPPAFPMAPLELLVRAREVVLRDREVVPERELDGLDELLRPRALPAREFVVFDLLDAPFRLVDFLDVDPLRFERVLDDCEREDRVVCAMVFASLGFRASSAIRAGGASRLTRCAEDLNGCKMIWNSTAARV